jgi:glycerol-3-phosphate acyltransferase PlsX
MIKIALDVMGGDFAPEATIDGAILALQDLPEGAKIILIGKEAEIIQLLDAKNVSRDSFAIINADEVIEMGEHPTKALSQKPKSSIVVGFELLKKQEADAFCSAGNTGAMLVGSMFSVKATEGVMRPAIAGFLPKENGSQGVLLDVGANAECKPEVLAQFGVLGSLYAQHVLHIPNPKVGLLNLGEEEQKGTMLTQTAFQLLKANPKINFVGNIEGRDLFNEKADVVVCDGFTGNVVLKMAEHFYDMVHKRNFSDPFLDKFNYETIGGSPIIGVNGNVLIAHGVSTPLAIKNMIFQGIEMAKAQVHVKIKNALSA